MRQSAVPQSDVHELGSPDYWYYKGELEARPSSVQPRPLAAGTGAYCDDSYCAHGSGRLGTDGGLSYEGTFVDGRMDGFGTYSDDSIDYVGRFKEGQPHGQGTLTCPDGRRFEGVFADGWLSGKHWLWVCKT